MSELRDGGHITIREATREDEQRLRAIAFTAKATWGYDRDRVHTWAETLQLFGETAPTAEIYVAETAGLAIAWMRLVPGNESCVLEDLWVAPISQRTGVGTKLFRFAERRACQLDAPRLEWEAEPNAIGFYERMGGRHIRDTPRNEWGRTLPVMADSPSLASCVTRRHLQGNSARRLDDLRRTNGRRCNPDDSLSPGRGSRSRPSRQR